MYHLGVPTTRALSLISTGEDVLRDMFYDGNPAYEPGAVVCRLSPTFTRFGNFEIFTSRNDLESLRKLVDYTIATDFPYLDRCNESSYLEWFSEVCRLTAVMIVHWMRVGFVHGVMNTDNMSISGLTIDYGPYGWLEDYNPKWTPNTTDASTSRYAFGNQPHIEMWNLTQLANTIYPLVQDADSLQQALDRSYRQEFMKGWQEMMVAKLGLREYREDSDEQFMNDLLDLLLAVETDMTIFYRQLASLDMTLLSPDDRQVPQTLLPAYYQPDNLDGQYLARLNKWLLSYRNRCGNDSNSAQERKALMNRTNPKYVLRNYLAQEAIELAEQQDYSRIHELLELLRHPYDEQPNYERYYARRPEWARHKPGSATLS
jgi:uncharacterized protein YdiU (UPF0061 family)